MKQFVSLAIFFVTTCLVLGQFEPAWWQSRGVLAPAAGASAYDAVNVGQVKNIVRATVAEMNRRLPGGASHGLNNLVAHWAPGSPNAANTDNYQVVTAGELKSVAGLLFARMEQVRQDLAPGWLPVLPPWAVSTHTGNDDEIVNAGQVKNLFLSLEGDRSRRPDSQINSLSDIDRADGRGHDGTRTAFGLSWLADTDGDLVSDVEEVVGGSDVFSSDSSHGALGLKVFTPFITSR